MKISFNWLKEYIPVDLTPGEVSRILTNTGLEVEGMEETETVPGGLKGVVVGQVVECRRHPNADRLFVTKVDVGNGVLLPIVCGAPNVAEGQKVPVALVGTTLTMGDKKLTLKKTKIRGEVSEGMICAEDELGLGNSHDGIMVLDPETPVGMPAADYFHIESDTVFEIGLTPNRIDGASHLGVARDLAAFLNQEEDRIAMRYPDVAAFGVDNHDLPIDIIIENEEGCRRYSGITLTNVKVGPSPDWLQRKLKSVGLTPINNVVDVTNFVLYETGHPMHAFDADKIKGNKVIIKTLPEGTPFRTLDGEIRKLSSEDLMICNEKEGMCIAGVFGGYDSGVKEETTSVFLESAWFTPGYIRKTARRHQLNTDASFRFERGADPNITVYALKRAAILIREITGGTISSEINDVYPHPISDFSVTLRYQRLAQLSGFNIPAGRVKKILKNLDIKIVRETDEQLDLKVPPYRVDVKREADVIEEVLRIYGYNNIPIPNHLKASLSYSLKPDKEKIVNMISDMLASLGFHEIMSNSLTAGAYYENGRDYPADRTPKLFNPLSSELDSLRQTLLFGGLEAVRRNINHKRNRLKLYEFGNVYYIDSEKKVNVPLKKYGEDFHFALFLSGPVAPASWREKPSDTDYYVLKSYVDRLVEKLGVPEITADKEEIRNSDIFQAALIYRQHNKEIVRFGEVHPDLLERFDIEQPVFFAEFRLDPVLKHLGKHKIIYREPAKFPEVRRDLALLLDKEVRFEDIRSLAFRTEKKILKKVTVFDVFEDPKLGENKKSYAVSFVLQDPGRTLTDKQIDGVMNRLIKAFEEKFDAKIR